VSAVIDRLSRRYPRVVFHVATGEAVALRRDLSERRVDLLIVRRFGPFVEEQLNFETLYENPYVVAAGINNPWVRRRRIGLADLVGELWALPPPDSAVGSVAVEAFRASGLEVPHATVVAFAHEMRINLLRTGRYLTILPQSVLRVPDKHPFLSELNVKLPIVSGPIGILTLKRRTLSPVAQLFIDCAHEVAEPLARRK
jgi:DNA-binding transcriptional LysR family regulator